MEIDDSRHRDRRIDYFFFHVVRQRDIQQFLYRRDRHLESNHEYEYAYEAACQGIQYCEFISQEYGSGYSQQRANRRQGIRPVVPGVCHHHGAFQFLALSRRVLIQGLFCHNGQSSSPNGYHFRRWHRLSFKDVFYFLDSHIHQVESNDGQHQCDYECRECLEFAVAVIVILVPAFARNSHEDYHYHVCDQVT